MKKKCIFPLALAAIMLLPLLASAAGFLNRISYTVNYDYSNLTVGTDTLGGVTYATVSYDGLYNGGAPGMPSLPIDYFKFSVPHNATNFTVRATAQRQINRNLDYLVYPCQMPWFTDGSQAPAITLPDTAAYYSGNSYPTQMAWIADEGFLAGENHIVTVAVMPLRYTHSASSDVLSGARICNLVLSYDLSDSLAMYPIVRNDSLLREEGYQLTQSMVVNPGQVKGFAPLTQVTTGIDSTGFIHGGIGGDVINGGEGGTPIEDTTNINIHYYSIPYLIVTTPELKHSVRRIAALKRQKGYNVKVVTMDEVLSSPFSGNGDLFGQGRFSHLAYSDDAGKLRQFLKNYYQIYGTKYVLLAGDIPYRHKADTIITTNSNNHKDTTVIDGISDFYYVELNSDWSTNDIGHQPSLFVGRILCDSSSHIDNYTDKLFRYELNPGNGDFSYLQNYCIHEGKDFANPLLKFKRNIVLIIPNEIKIEEKYSNVEPTGKDVIDTLNYHNVGLACFYNHGDTTRIKVYGPDGQGREFFIESVSDTSTGNGLNCLNNRYRPMIFYFPNCTTVPFDNYNGINMGKSFTIGKDYGGPVYIGNTRQITPGSASGIVGSFATELKNGFTILGMADALSIGDYIRNPHNQDPAFVHAYLGDPAMEIWTDIPQFYSDIEVIRNEQSVTVSGWGNEPAIITCADNSQNVSKRVATSSVTFSNVSPNSMITIYRQNMIPFMATLKLQNASFIKSQYIIASDVIAGSSIDNKRPNGDAIIKNGVEYEIEASGTVTLEDGFKVEKGATFAVYPASF